MMRRRYSATILGVLLVLTVVLLASCGRPVASRSRAEGIVDSLAKSDFASVVATFRPALKAVYTADRLAQVWGEVITRAGQFKSRAKSRERKKRDYDIVYVTCHFEKGDIDVMVVFDKSRQVCGLSMVPYGGQK